MEKMRVHQTGDADVEQSVGPGACCWLHIRPLHYSGDHFLADLFNLNSGFHTNAAIMVCTGPPFRNFPPTPIQPSDSNIH